MPKPPVQPWGSWMWYWCNMKSIICRACDFMIILLLGLRVDIAAKIRLGLLEGSLWDCKSLGNIMLAADISMAEIVSRITAHLRPLGFLFRPEVRSQRLAWSDLTSSALEGVETT